MRQLAVFAEPGGAEIDVAVCLVCKALIHECFDDPDDFAHILSDLRMNGRLHDIERGGVLLIFRNIAFGNFF